MNKHIDEKQIYRMRGQHTLSLYLSSLSLLYPHLHLAIHDPHLVGWQWHDSRQA
jgi:hypothetical protein